MYDDFWKILNNENILKEVNGVSNECINEIEQQLGAVFSEEYKYFLSMIGACIYKGHEIVGICKFSDLSVLDVTKYARQINPEISSEWYVIEDAHIDCVFIWQDRTGSVYQTSPYSETKKIADSLHGYLGFVF